MPNKAKGVLNIKLARLSSITNDDLCAEDPDAVMEAIDNNPDLATLLKKAKSNLSGLWDLDSSYVSNLEVSSVKGTFIESSHPALKNVEIKFSCDLDEDASEDDINSDLMAGLMPIIEASQTRLVFFDCDDMSVSMG